MQQQIPPRLSTMRTTVGLRFLYGYMDYDKQPINVDEQVALLQNRGLVIEERACVIGKLENECVKAFLDHEEEILAGTFEGALIDHISEHERNAYITCTQVSRKKIYASKPVLDIELSGYKIMATLMEVFIDAAVNPSRFYSKQLLRRVSSQYDIENESLEERINGSIGLHQRHDGYLCLRYLSEDQRNKSADSIETKQAFLIFLRKSVLNKER